MLVFARSDLRHDIPGASRIARFVSARFIKLVGNFLKAPFYLLYLVQPNKRFVIPHRANPLLKINRASNIPRTVWQTNYTDHVTLPVYVNYLFNRLLAPGYEFRFMGDLDAEEFVRTEYPGRVFDLYSRLQIGAARADLWRILVLQKYGGAYLDIDAHLVWPLERIIPRDAEELFLEHKEGLSNYFLASREENPHLQAVIEEILNGIERPSPSDIFEMSGPAVLNRVLDKASIRSAPYKITCYQGTFTNEFFQYVDCPIGKWSKAQATHGIVSNEQH